MSIPVVEGYSEHEPIEDDDWVDEVRWQVNLWWQERREGHDQDGYFCDAAGDPTCLALGHKPDEDGEWEYDTHPSGWEGEQVCPATRYDSACTVCEGECQWGQFFDPTALWEAVSRPIEVHHD
jgi:hypothetical protein